MFSHVSCGMSSLGSSRNFAGANEKQPWTSSAVYSYIYSCWLQHHTESSCVTKAVDLFFQEGTWGRWWNTLFSTSVELQWKFCFHLFGKSHNQRHFFWKKSLLQTFPNFEWGHISQWAPLSLGKSTQSPEEPAGALHEGSDCVGCTQQLTSKLGFQERNYRKMQSSHFALRQKPGSANSFAGSRTFSLWASSLWGGASADQPSELPQPQPPQACVPYTALFEIATSNFKQCIAFKS